MDEEYIKKYHSTEVITPKGRRIPSPYNLSLYFCIVGRLTRKNVENKTLCIEMVIEHMLKSIEWCEKELKKAGWEKYIKDKSEIEKYLKRLIVYYRQTKPLQFMKFSERRPQILEYVDN